MDPILLPPDCLCAYPCLLFLVLLHPLIARRCCCRKHRETVEGLPRSIPDTHSLLSACECVCVLFIVVCWAGASPLQLARVPSSVLTHPKPSPGISWELLCCCSRRSSTIGWRVSLVIWGRCLIVIVVNGSVLCSWRFQGLLKDQVSFNCHKSLFVHNAQMVLYLKTFNKLSFRCNQQSYFSSK